MNKKIKFPIVIGIAIMLAGLLCGGTANTSHNPEEKKSARDLYIMGLREYRNKNFGKARIYLHNSYRQEQHSHSAYLLAIIFMDEENGQDAMKFALEALEGRPPLKEKYRNMAVDILKWAVEKIKNYNTPGKITFTMAKDGVEPKDLMKMIAVLKQKEREKKGQKKQEEEEQQISWPEELYKYIPRSEIESRLDVPYPLNPAGGVGVGFFDPPPGVEVPGDDLWPYREFAYANAYLYNLDNKLRGKHAVVKNNKLDPTIVGEGVRLTPPQVEAVVRLTNKDIGGLIQGLSKSYIPHHGIVFFDKNHQPVAYITFCFDCEALRLHPQNFFAKNPHPLTDKKIKELLELLSQYKRIIQELKFPVFKSPLDYQRYGKQ